MSTNSFPKPAEDPEIRAILDEESKKIPQTVGSVVRDSIIPMNVAAAFNGSLSYQATQQAATKMIPALPEVFIAGNSRLGGAQHKHILHLMTLAAEQCNWIELANNVIAAACAHTVPQWRVSSKNKSDKKAIENIEEVLEFPNPHQSGYQLQYQTYYDLNLYGNAFWQVIKNRAGQIHSIYTIPPETIRVIPIQEPDGNLTIMYVQISVPSGPRLFESDEIVHFKRPNALSFLYGKPLYYSQLMQVATSIQSKQAITSWFEKGFSGGAIFKMDPAPDVADRNRQILQDIHTKPENFGAILLLEGGIEMVSDGNKFKEFDFEKLSSTDRDNIMFSAGIPISMAGIRSAGGNANAEVVASEEMAFNMITVTPNHRLVCSVINNKLFRQILGLKNVRIEPGVQTKFSMSSSIAVVEALAKFGIGINEARDLMGAQRVPNDVAGSTFVIATNNGSIPASKVVGIDYNDGSKVETLFEQEQKNQEAANNLKAGAHGMGGHLKDKSGT